MSHWWRQEGTCLKLFPCASRVLYPLSKRVNDVEFGRTFERCIVSRRLLKYSMPCFSVLVYRSLYFTRLFYFGEINADDDDDDDDDDDNSDELLLIFNVYCCRAWNSSCNWVAVACLCAQITNRSAVGVEYRVRLGSEPIHLTSRTQLSTSFQQAEHLTAEPVIGWQYFLLLSVSLARLSGLRTWLLLMTASHLLQWSTLFTKR